MKDILTAKTRILNAITGGEVDRLPWCPFLAYYWNYLSDDIKNIGQIEYMKSLGADPMIRGSHVLAEPIYNNCKITETIKGHAKQSIYETPVGNLIMKHTYSPQGKTWYLTTHPVAKVEDFKVLQYIYENITFKDNIKGFEQDKIALGNDGLHVPILSTQAKTAFQSLIETWCGTIDLTYAVYDYPNVVEQCLAVMQDKNSEAVNIAVESSAEAFIFWEDSSTTNLSPTFFEKYTKPEIDNWGDIIHRENRLLMHHACGHLNGLIELIGDSNIDVLESISPPPTGDIELVDARDRLPEHIAIIGGIEPVKFLTYSKTELEKYVMDIIENMKNTRFVLANSDSCPPGVEEEKFRIISNLVIKA